MYDRDRGAYKVNIKERAEDNKANKEVINFFKKLSKKDVKIIKGMKSKEKVLRFIG